MDLTAFALCRENALPIMVYDSGIEGNLKKLLSGDAIERIENRN